MGLENTHTPEGAPEWPCWGKTGVRASPVDYYDPLILLDVYWVLLGVTNGVRHSTCLMSLNPLKKPML